MSSEEDYDDLVYDDDEGFDQDGMDPGESLVTMDVTRADIVESESEPDAYDVLSPGIEGERSLQSSLLISRSAKEEAV